MSSFRVRVEALADDALIVVRGGTLERTALRADAVTAHRRFGEYGISVFAAPEQSDLVDLARDRLVRFRELTLMTAGAIRAVGLELRPTFRRPHYTVVFAQLERDLERLLTCETVQWPNPHANPE